MGQDCLKVVCEAIALTQPHIVAYTWARLKNQHTDMGGEPVLIQLICSCGSYSNSQRAWCGFLILALNKMLPLASEKSCLASRFNIISICVTSIGS